MNADAVPRRISCRVEQLPRPGWIIRILAYTRIVGPTLGWQHAGSRPDRIPPKKMHERSPVDGMSNGLAHANVLQNRVAKIERHVGEDSSGSAQHLEVRFAFECRDHVRWQRIYRDIGAALPQFKSACCGIGNNDETHSVKLCLLAPIAVIPRDHDFLVLLGAHEAKWPGTNRVLTGFRQRSIRNNPHSGAARDIP